MNVINFIIGLTGIARRLLFLREREINYKEFFGMIIMAILFSAFFGFTFLSISLIE